MVAYAIATFLAFPHPVGAGVLDLGVGLAWVAPACLLMALRGAPPRRAGAIGFAAGLLAHAAVLHWIYVVTVVYGHAPPAVGVVAPVLLAAYVAAFTAAFGALAAWLAARGAGSPLVLAATWTVLDHARSFVLTGFPWATLGYAQHANPVLVGLAPFTGVYGLSFVSVLGAAVALGLAGRARELVGTRRQAGVGAAVGAALLVLGATHGAWLPEVSGPTVRMAVLQGNIDQGVKWSPDWAQRTLSIYESLSRRAAEEGARVVIWPETAVPGSPDGDPALSQRLADLAAEIDATLVVGAVGIDGLDRGFDRARLHDSAFVFDPDGTFRGRYDKTHLVPFGEYLPLRGLLGRFIRAVATGSAGRDVAAGPAPRALTLAPEPGEGGRSLTVGIPICYELLFPDLMRRFVVDGAGVLLGITNDAWYGRTGAPFQFLAITALRSAETGVWTARAANTGVSAFIDPRGRVHERTAIFERDLRVRDVPVRETAKPVTFYARHGDLFAWACWAGVGLAAASARLRRRRPAGPGRRS